MQCTTSAEVYADNARKIKSARSHLQAEQSLQARINISSSWIPRLRESEKILSRRSLVLGCYYKFFVHISSCLSGGRCIVMTWSTKRQPKCQANIFLSLPILWIHKTMLAFCISNIVKMAAFMMASATKRFPLPRNSSETIDHILK